ncbi:MAG: hypothetical protein Rubg2KO_25760 [Rubricoccaceae bacterium]
MAQQLDYTYPPGPPGETTFTAQDDLARLLETLHTSGTLRAANGLVAQFQDVASIVLKGLDSPEGRNGLANALILAKLLGQLDADGLDRLIEAVSEGMEAAGERLASTDDAPSTVAVLSKLRQPDVRRGLDAALTLLGTVGAQLNAPSNGTSSNLPDQVPSPSGRGTG